MNKYIVFAARAFTSKEEAVKHAMKIGGNIYNLSDLERVGLKFSVKDHGGGILIEIEDDLLVRNAILAWAGAEYDAFHQEESDNLLVLKIPEFDKTPAEIWDDLDRLIATQSWSLEHFSDAFKEE